MQTRVRPSYPLLQFHESDIIESLEEMCDPDTDAGEWITRIDLQEKGDKLQLVEMAYVSGLLEQRGSWTPCDVHLPSRYRILTGIYEFILMHALREASAAANAGPSPVPAMMSWSRPTSLRWGGRGGGGGGPRPNTGVHGKAGEVPSCTLMRQDHACGKPSLHQCSKMPFVLALLCLDANSLSPHSYLPPPTSFAAERGSVGGGQALVSIPDALLGPHECVQEEDATAAQGEGGGGTEEERGRKKKPPPHH